VIGAPRLRPGARSLTRRQRRAALVLLIVAVLFIAVDTAAAPFRDARGGASGLLGSLARGTDSIVGPPRRFLQGLGGDDASKRADDLQKQNAQLRAQLAQNQVDSATAAQLAALQLQASDTGIPVLPAKVIGTSASQGFEWTVTVDVGTGDGVQPGQTVIAGASLIGRVLDVRGSSTTILLVVDPDSGVGVRDQRTGQLGVLSGDGTSTLSFAPMDPNADVQAGDQLLSGPAGSSTYVADIPIATVRSVGTAPSGARVAAADPLQSLTALDLLGILLAPVPNQPASTPAPNVTNNAQPAPGATTSRAPLQPGGGG
jgi:rod shape-determining protein MreC